MLFEIMNYVKSTENCTFFFKTIILFCCNNCAGYSQEYIFPLPRNAFPREGTGVKTDFFFREKVSLSAVVGKKDSCLTDWSSCLPKVRLGRQRR